MGGLEPSRDPHFGLLRAGGVYTQTIILHNVDATRSLRPIVTASQTSQQHNRGKNKVRIFLRDNTALAPGTKMSIDLVLVAVEPASFCDSIQVSRGFEPSCVEALLALLTLAWLVMADQDCFGCYPGLGDQRLHS